MQTADFLRSAGLRATKPREAVLAILEDTPQPLSAEEIFDAVSGDLDTGRSTIYRVLSQLTERGLLLKNDACNGIAYYQLNTHSHRHTLHCTICGSVVPIDGCPLAELEQRLQRETGYQITGHSLAFSGICPACRKKGVKLPKEKHST